MWTPVDPTDDRLLMDVYVLRCLCVHIYIKLWVILDITFASHCNIHPVNSPEKTPIVMSSSKPLKMPLSCRGMSSSWQALRPILSLSNSIAWPILPYCPIFRDFFSYSTFLPRSITHVSPTPSNAFRSSQVWLPREGCWAKCVTGPVRFSCTAMSPSSSSRGSVVVLDGSWSLTCFVFDWAQLSGQRCCDQVLYTAIGKGWIHVWKRGVSRWDFFDHLVL